VVWIGNDFFSRVRTGNRLRRFVIEVLYWIRTRTCKKKISDLDPQYYTYLCEWNYRSRKNLNVFFRTETILLNRQVLGDVFLRRVQDPEAVGGSHHGQEPCQVQHQAAQQVSSSSSSPTKSEWQVSPSKGTHAQDFTDRFSHFLASFKNRQGPECKKIVNLI
jgi:hypothetical protein